MCLNYTTSTRMPLVATAEVLSCSEAFLFTAKHVRSWYSVLASTTTVQKQN